MDKSPQNPSTSAFSLVFAHMNLNGRLSAAVESDIVGYTTMTMDNLGYEIISLPFGDLAITEQVAFPIQNIVGELSQSDRETRADRLMTLDPVTKQYTTYVYKMKGWTKIGETEPTTDVIFPGTAVFFKKAVKAGTFTVSGKILSPSKSSGSDEDGTAKVVEIPLKYGLNLVANPFPTDIKIADLKGSLTASDRESRADKIMVMDPVTKAYTSYQYKASTGWTKEGEEVETTDTIAAKNGFFYKKAVTEGMLQFECPF